MQNQKFLAIGIALALVLGTGQMVAGDTESAPELKSFKSKIRIFEQANKKPVTPPITAPTAKAEPTAEPTSDPTAEPTGDAIPKAKKDRIKEGKRKHKKRKMELTDSPRPTTGTAVKPEQFSIETPQTSAPQRPKSAAPPEDCKLCTTKKCEHNIKNKSDCISRCPEPHYTSIGCRAAKISEEDIKTESDAGNFGSLTKDDFLHEMKTEKPLATFWFNEKMVAGEMVSGKTQMVPSIKREYGDSPIKNEEITQITYVLEKMGNICKNNILDRAKSLFEQKNLGKFPEAKIEMDQLEKLYTSLNDKIEKSKVGMKSETKMSISEFKEEYPAKTLLLFKNCMNSGNILLFRMKNTDYENNMKKGCVEDCKDSNCQKFAGYKKCRINCSISNFTDACTKIAKKCKGKKCISPYRQYQDYVEQQKVCEEVCVDAQCKDNAYAQNCFDKCKQSNLKVGCEKIWETREK